MLFIRLMGRGPGESRVRSRPVISLSWPSRAPSRCRTLLLIVIPRSIPRPGIPIIRTPSWVLVILPIILPVIRLTTMASIIIPRRYVGLPIIRQGDARPSVIRQGHARPSVIRQGDVRAPIIRQGNGHGTKGPGWKGRVDETGFLSQTNTRVSVRKSRAFREENYVVLPVLLIP